MNTANRWQQKALARRRWSLNAVRAKERKRLAALATWSDMPADLPDTMPAKRSRMPFDLRVNLERRDGGRVQFTLHHFYGKLISEQVNLTPKQFGRKLGEMFALWMRD
jgi:hypothetical protein